MDDQPLKHKSYDAPSVSPQTLRAIALGHFLFASFTFVALAIGNVVDGNGIDKNLAGAVANIDSPQAKKMKHILQRTGDIKESLQQHMSRRLPARRWVEPANQLVYVGLALLLLAAGSCVAQRRPLGRTLSLVFAGVCLTQQMIMMAWQQLAEVPTAGQYLEQLIRLYPNDGDLIRGILTPITNGPTFHLLIAVYPLCVLAIMLQPGVKELLSAQSGPADRSTELPITHRIAMTPSSTTVASPDPLEELLQRKTF